MMGFWKKSRLRRAAGVILAAVMLPAAAGCSMQVEPYLVPPKLQGEQLEIQKALDEYVTGTLKMPHYIMKYPKNRGQTSAFIRTSLEVDWITKNMADTEQEPEEVAIAFYQDAAKTGNVHINMLRTVDGDWASVSDVEGLGTDIENVAFGDLDGDGLKEMLIGWNIYNSQEKQLHVYSMRNDTLTAVSTDNLYTEWFLGDVTSSGKDDLVLFRLEGNNRVTARLKTLQDGRMTDRGTVSLDGYIQRFGSMKIGKLADGVNGLYVDATRDANTTITELIYWDKQLYAPFYDPVSNATLLTARTSGLASRDIDTDGQVEYPICTRLPGYHETTEPQEYMWLTQWYSWDYAAQQVQAEFYSLVNTADGYYIRLEDAWKDQVTATYEAQTHTLMVCTAPDGKIGEPFLAVRVTRDGSAAPASASIPDADFKLWYEDEATGTTYRFWYCEDNPFGINDQSPLYMLGLLI